MQASPVLSFEITNTYFKSSFFSQESTDPFKSYFGIRNFLRLVLQLIRNSNYCNS